MDIKPDYYSIDQLFSIQYVFRIPKYQRNFAWEETQVEDFISDINKCYIVKFGGDNRHHFFGGIVSVKHEIPGSSRLEFDVVDGQQRLATFVLFAGCMIHSYRSLIGEASDEDLHTINFQLDELTKKYIYFDDMVNRKVTSIRKLQMAGPDQPFFEALLANSPIDASRESHNRINNAYYQSLKFINEKLEVHDNVSGKLDVLENIRQILADDLTVIFLSTQSKKEAYKLFQVLNDRGTGLTAGDLLRSRTLEMLEVPDFQHIQARVQQAWDDILADTPEKTEDFLRWFYSSINGNRPGKATLLDDFLQAFFPDQEDAVEFIANNEEQATNVLEVVTKFQNEVHVLRKLSKGEWPFEEHQAINLWHKERLRLLVKELQLTNYIPLLLAAFNVFPPQEFSELVQIIERFMFRYKIICGGHVTPMNSVYLRHSQQIRQLGENYDLETLKTDLRNLLHSSAGDEKFRIDLRGVFYKERGGNKPLKYFIMTLEHYARWYYDGANDSPDCLDMTRHFDFSSITLEHIYPKNAALLNPDLEDLNSPINKHCLGNITFMGSTDNVVGGNQEFEQKRSIFQNSSVLLNRGIGENTNWGANEVELHREDMIEIALTVFVI